MSGDLTIPTAGKPTPPPWRVFGPQAQEHGIHSLTILAGTGKSRFGVAHVSIINPNDALEASANARLIAAAPDLLAAAEAQEELKNFVGDDARIAIKRVQQMRHNAILKARGEQP